MPIDLDGPDPLYLQIAAVLTARIQDGTYEANRRIPSEPTLAAQFGVSRPTVRKALALLAEDGLIRSVRGRGTFALSQGEARTD